MSSAIFGTAYLIHQATPVRVVASLAPTLEVDETGWIFLAFDEKRSRPGVPAR